MPHPQPRPSQSGLLSVVTALAVAHALLAGILLLIRLSSVARHGVWVETTGFEGIGLNVTAYTQHH